MNIYVKYFLGLLIVVMGCILWLVHLGRHTASAAEGEAAGRLTKQINRQLGESGVARYEISTDSLYVHVHSNDASSLVREMPAQVRQLVASEPQLVKKRVWVDFVDAKGVVSRNIEITSQEKK